MAGMQGSLAAHGRATSAENPETVRGPGPDAAYEENVVCFSSGWGDGHYPSFFGLASDGRPHVLLTDFLLLNRADFDGAQ
jgi:hypothetical protein